MLMAKFEITCQGYIIITRAKKDERKRKTTPLMLVIDQEKRVKKDALDRSYVITYIPPLE